MKEQQPKYTYVHADGTDCDHEGITWEQSEDEGMAGPVPVRFTTRRTCSAGLAITGVKAADPKRDLRQKLRDRLRRAA